MNAFRRNSRRMDIIIILLAFVVSRVLFYVAGVRYVSFESDDLYQYIDPILLKDHLLESIWFQHSQPPLLNVGIGLAMKIFGNGAHTALMLLWIFMGAAISILIYRFGMRLTGSRFWSLAGALFFIVDPSSILFENWLFYSYPVAILTILWVLLVSRMVDAPSWKNAWLLGSVALALAWLRSPFHITVIAVLLAASATVVSGTARRRIAVVSIIVIAAISSLYIKNYVLFGQFSASSWLGMNLARITVMKVDSLSRLSMVEDGRLSPVSMVRPFRPLSAYRCTSVWKGRDIPVLTAPVKTTGQPNLNHYCYLEIEAQYRRDCYYVITHMPGTYIQGVIASWMNFFIPASDFWFGNPNPGIIDPYVRVFNTIFFGQYHPRNQIPRKGSISEILPKKLLACGLWLVILIPVSVGIAIRCGLALRSASEPHERTRSVILLFSVILFSVFSTVTNLLEVGENNRFRFEVEPIVMILFIHALHRISGNIRARMMRRPLYAI